MLYLTIRSHRGWKPMLKGRPGHDGSIKVGKTIKKQATKKKILKH